MKSWGRVLFITFFCLAGSLKATASEPTCSLAAILSPVTSIRIVAPDSLSEKSVSGLAIKDFENLLSEAFPGLRITRTESAEPAQSGQVLIRLPLIDPHREQERSHFASSVAYPILDYPDHDYRWQSHCENGQIVLELETPSHAGVSAALYGLLQEKLGFRFIHPKQTLKPFHAYWPLPPEWTFEGRAIFQKKGFHLHTMHPIELAEPLHGMPGDAPEPLTETRQYIDWLARNQQNVFQFYLLREVDQERFIQSAQQMIDYAHQRGILVGAAISLSMFQQKAFQLIRILDITEPYEKQMDRTLSSLFRAPWDFVSIDFTTGEYLPDLGSLGRRLRNLAIQKIQGRYGKTLYSREHVIPAEKDNAQGIHIHSVMCYSVTEPKAPVYGHENQNFVLDELRLERERRETWYFPESSYWVTFDNSVPVFLLPYLDSRLIDIETMRQERIHNHLTFSSGWEWGYWLIDWSIARWSWAFLDNGVERRPRPAQGISDVFGAASGLEPSFTEALALQNRFLKDQELLRYLSALAPMDELPQPFNKPFQPKPPFTFEWLRKVAGLIDQDRLLRETIEPLEAFATAHESITREMRDSSSKLRETELRRLADELITALEVTTLRARHRALVLRAYLSDRWHPTWLPLFGEAKERIDQAEKVREQAQRLVFRQERHYRYDPEKLGRKRPSVTAYQFGYLYPVSELHFWRREEDQLRYRRFDALFNPLYDFKRVLGFDLLWGLE